MRYGHDDFLAHHQLGSLLILSLFLCPDDQILICIPHKDLKATKIEILKGFRNLAFSRSIFFASLTYLSKNLAYPVIDVNLLLYYFLEKVFLIKNLIKILLSIDHNFGRISTSDSKISAKTRDNTFTATVIKNFFNLETHQIGLR